MTPHTPKLFVRETPLTQSLIQASQTACWTRWLGHTVPQSVIGTDEEEAAFFERAVLFDLAPIRKYVVSGPDALAFVDRLCTRNVRDLLPARAALSPVVDDRGLMIDVITVYRLEDRVFQIASEVSILGWLEAGSAGLDVEVEPLSEAVGVAEIAGPRAEAVLRAAGLLSAGFLAPGAMDMFEGGGLRLHICRRGIGAPDAFELWYPAESGGTLWQRLMEAGANHGLVPAGHLCRRRLRVALGLAEEGRDYGGALTLRDRRMAATPFELGLGAYVHFAHRAFSGRAALRVLQEWPQGRDPIVRLELEGTEIPAAARLLYDGRPAGHVTAAVRSEILMRTLALGRVRAALAGKGTKLHVDFTLDGPGGPRRVAVQAKILGPAYGDAEATQRPAVAPTRRWAPPHRDGNLPQPR